MNSSYFISSLFVFILSCICSVYSNAAFQLTGCSPDAVLCPGESVLLNCHGNQNDYLSWSVIDSNGAVVSNVSFDGSAVVMVGDRRNLTAGGVVFYFNKTTATDIVANFTAAGSIDGYWIACNYHFNGVISESYNCSLDIDSALPVPQNFSFDYSTITSQSIYVNWTDPVSTCVSQYRVNLTIDGNLRGLNATDSNYYMINRNDINPGLPPDEYCISVASVGINGSTGPYTNPQCIAFARPFPVQNLRYNPMFVDSATPLLTQINVTVLWDVRQTSRPMTRRYYITHNVTHTVESGSGSAVGSAGSGIGDDATKFITIMRPGFLNRFLLQGVLVGNTYTVSVVPYNVLGNGTARNLTFTILPAPPTDMPTTTTTTTSVEPTVITMSPTVMNIPTVLPVWAIAVIAAVGGGVVIAAILAGFIAFVCICCCCMAAKKVEEHEMEAKGTTL